MLVQPARRRGVQSARLPLSPPPAGCPEAGARVGGGSERTVPVCVLARVAPHRRAPPARRHHQLGYEARVLDRRLTTPSRLLASREPPIARADKLIARLGHGVSMIILIVDRRQLEELARIDCPRRRRAILRILALRRSVLVVEGPEVDPLMRLLPRLDGCPPLLLLLGKPLRRLPFPPLVQRLALLRRWSRRQFGPRPRPHVALSSLLPNLLLPPLPLLRFSRTGGRSLPLSLLFQLRTQPLRLTLLRLHLLAAAVLGLALVLLDPLLCRVVVERLSVQSSEVVLLLRRARSGLVALRCGWSHAA
mmetsp:Transcript_37553/g.112034  ORF Transcript_37553/g.112034 Transcript_37553/m.112034 type:complete len:306 (-) Transcript_37553:157-1074(-)